MAKVHLFVVLLVAGCGEPPLEIPEGCQPLYGGGECFLPYPSDFYRVDDAAQPAGKRVALSGAARLVTKDALDADLHDEAPLDGFSRVPTIVAYLPAEIAGDGFVGVLDDYTRSVEVDSPTVILDAETGERVPHYVDLDSRAEDPTRRAIVLHPAVGLRPRARYIVAIYGVQTVSGDLAPAPAGFARLRDGAAEEPALRPLRDRYEAEIFPPLAKAGVGRKGLQLAWDFTTRSEESATEDMLRVRELTLAWLEKNVPAVVVDEVVENGAEHIWRTVRGTITGPLFTTSAEPGARLFRGADGRVAQNGTATFPFLAQIPLSAQAGGPTRVVAFGHGFFGSREEIAGASTRPMADRLRATFVSIDWWGMSDDDLGVVVKALGNKPHEALSFTDRIPQAMANWIVTTAAIRGPFGAQTAFQRPGTGEPIFDAADLGFIGISQGHILGGTLAALNPDLARVVLQVGGAGLSHLMMRARPFDRFLFLISLVMPEPLDQQKFVAMTQTLFDRIDPATYAPYLLATPLAGSPARRVLMQQGLGDTEVPNLGTDLHARLLGLPLLEPSPSPVWGLETTAGPVPSAMAVYDFGIDLAAVYRKPEAPREENLVHGGLRRLEAVHAQIDAFLRPDGAVTHTCDGVCDPE